MKKVFTLRNIGLVSSMVTGLVLIVAWSSAQSQVQNRVQIINKLTSIRAESVREINRGEHLSQFETIVRNVSPQPIKAITLKIEDSQTVQDSIDTSSANGLNNDWVLMPNETVNMRFDAALGGNVRVIFVAVMFDNGNTEGDRYFTEQLKNKKEGIKLAYQRILPILRRTSNLLTDDVPDEALEAMINEVKSIDQTNIPQELTVGFLNGRTDIVSSLEYLKKQKNNPRKNRPLKPKEICLKNLARIERVLGKP